MENEPKKKKNTIHKIMLYEKQYKAIKIKFKTYKNNIINKI